jgi:hypothetical protein
VPNSGKPSVVSTVIDIGDGTTRDGLELARACVAEWERILTQAGLSIVRRSERDGGASGRHLTRIFTAAGTGQIASPRPLNLLIFPLVTSLGCHLFLVLGDNRVSVFVVSTPARKGRPS